MRPHSAWLLQALLTLVICVIPTVSSALPRVFRQGTARVKRIACELYLSGDRGATLVQLIESGKASSLDREGEFDLTGLLSDLAGTGYDKIQQQLATSNARRTLLEAEGGAAFGSLLNTSAGDLHRIRRAVELKPGEHIVDLGSGHGAPAFYFGALYPDTVWTGLELSNEKVVAANAVAQFVGLSNVHFEQRDLADSLQPLPQADTYYLLNPVRQDVLVTIFDHLRVTARTKKIRIIALGIQQHLTDIDTSWLDVQNLGSASLLEPPIWIMQSR